MPRKTICCTSLLAFAIAATVSCGEYVSEVTGLQSFDPPPIYREWWAATESCSGRRAPFERVNWFLVTNMSLDGRPGLGRWQSPHEIAITRGYENDQKLVRHEILHDLLNGDHAHGRSEWDSCDIRFDGGVAATVRRRLL
jgi:hypothetical protein